MTPSQKHNDPATDDADTARRPDMPDADHESPADETRPTEYGGRKGPDPVRYGDWEKNGRCIDF